ncbi:hypothetical protein Pelo_15656 [Pelomyxa schiedti]|nr:hypothetical protein Pelo_15656 [Pelomyxa schiedti]
MSDHNLQHAVRGTLATPPEHALWARDQLMPLLACAAVPRCGARSPASLVPHSVIACDIGQTLVMCAARRVIIGGYRLINTAGGGAGANVNSTVTDCTGGGFNLVVVGVSITLGVVELWGWGQIAHPGEVGGWLGGSLPMENNTHILVVDPLEMTVVEEEVLGFEHCKYLQICKGRKWAVLFTKFEAEKIAICPLGLKGGVCRTIDITGQIVEVDMIDDDEVALSTTDGDYASRGGYGVFCADLERSYNSGQLVVTHSFLGFGSLVFRSKKHNLVAPMYAAEQTTLNGGGQLVLKSLFTREMIICPTWSCKKVDYTHFAEEDKTNHTVNVFSTGDDFGRPVRIFALNRFLCGNGIIALTQQEEGPHDGVSLERRIAIMGDHLLPDPSVDDTDDIIRHFVFVGVSPTLGVVGLWACRASSKSAFGCMRIIPAGLFGDRLGVMEGTRDGKIGIANLVTHEVREVDDPGFVGTWTYRVCSGRKWVVIWDCVKPQQIVVLSVSWLEHRSQESDTESYWKVVNVGRKALLVSVFMNTNDCDGDGDDEATFVTREYGGVTMVDMWHVDLKRSFESGELFVTGTFCGIATLVEIIRTTAVYHSKEHKVILSLPNADGTTTQWKSISPSQLPIILHESHCPITMVDNSYFAEEDRASETLRVFSTDDFDHPVHVFPLRRKDIKVLCGNGLIVLWDEGHFDVFDAVTGTWLLHQPSHRPIHKLSLRAL